MGRCVCGWCIVEARQCLGSNEARHEVVSVGDARTGRDRLQLVRRRARPAPRAQARV